MGSIALLREAEHKALALFEAIEARGQIAAGKKESELNEAIFVLAEQEFGIKKHWHKRIIRSGANTLLPYNENPPDLTIGTDDILFFDFGPVFEEWEADLGRTYVIGSDPYKLKLKADVEQAWHEAKAWFEANEDCTGSELYAYMLLLARSFGWEFGGEIAGHIVGHFPHERLEDGTRDLYIHPDNHFELMRNGKDGHPLHWILEIHFVDRERQIGGFFEQLMV